MQKHLMAPAIATAMALSLGIQTSTARAQDASSASTAKMPESSGQQELSLADILDLRMTAIASGTLKPLNKTPAVATVITAADIKAMGIRTWAEAIDTVPGLHIATGPVYGEKILIRGIASFFNPEVLVMINGVPTTSIVRGDRNAYRNLINLSAVSRIEIIRGPGSALYGAEAVAGVINIVTKTGEEIQGSEIGGRAGTFNTNEGWVQHGNKYGDLKLALTGNFATTDGHERVIESDSMRATGKSLAPGPTKTQGETTDVVVNADFGKWSIDSQYHGDDGIGLGQGVADSLDPKSSGGWKRATLNLTYQDPRATADWGVMSKLSYQYMNQTIQSVGLQSLPPGINLGSGVLPNGAFGKPEWQERHWYFDLVGIYKGFDSHIVRLGLGGADHNLFDVQNSNTFTSSFAPRSGYTNLTDTNQMFLPKKRRSNYHMIAQDEWNLNQQMDLTLGVRFDHFSDFGEVVNPRAAYVWNFHPDWTTKLLIGKAFRSPSFGELYTANNPAQIGNEFLRPETNLMYEWAMSWDPSRAVTVGLNLYRWELRNFINFVRDAGATTRTAQNLGDYNGEGLEFEFRYRVSPFLLFTGNYAYNMSVDQVTGSQMGDFPNQQAYLSQQWNFMTNWDLNAQVRWIGARMRSPTDSRAALNGYTTVDLITRGKRIYRDWELAVSVRNMFDADVREPGSPPNAVTGVVPIPNDLPGAPRTYFAELSTKF